MCVSNFSTTMSKTFYFLRRNERDTIETAYLSPHKVRFSLVRFYWNLDFPDIFSEKYSNIIFHENPPSGAELFHVDGRAHMKKLIAVFRNVANATKILMTGSYGKWVKGYGLDSALCVTLWTRQ